MSTAGPAPAEALEEAFDRLEDFRSVWAGGITVEAAQRLLESVGIEEPQRRRFAERLAEVEPRAAPGAVLLGLLIGLSAAQLAGELLTPRAADHSAAWIMVPPCGPPGRPSSRWRPRRSSTARGRPTRPAGSCSGWRWAGR